MGLRLQQSIVNRSRWVLLVAAIVAVASLGEIVDLRRGTPTLRLDPSLDGMLPGEDPERAYYDAFKERFASGEVLLLALEADDLFEAEHLTRLETLSAAIEELEIVDHVSSLPRSLNIRSVDGALSIEPFYDEVPATMAGLDDLRARALGDPIYAGNLVSRDGRVAVVLVHLFDLPEAEILASGVDAQLAELAASHWRGGDFWISGGMRVKAEMSRLMLRDTQVVVPIAALVMALIAFIAFRTVRGVVVPLTTVAIATLLTLAFIANVYGDLNQITGAIPSVMIVVGFAYSMHVVAAYDDAVRAAGANAGERPALTALSKVATPVIFTGLTTAAGFGSLATSSLTAIQQYGVATALGVLFATFATLTVAPALLDVLPAHTARSLSTRDSRFNHSLVRLARFDMAHRRTILTTGAVVAVISGLGVPRLIVGSDLVSSLRHDNPVRAEFDHINEELEGGNVIQIALETDLVEGFKEPASLEQIEALQRWLATQHDVGGSTSPADYIKALHRGIEGGAREKFAIPDSKALVSQLLVVGANEELDRYVDHDFQSARVEVRTRAMDSVAVLDLVERIEARLDTFPGHIEARVTGNSVLISRTMDDIAIGQAKSLLVAFGMIYLILTLLFTSFKTGAIALIPNALPVLVYFGILGWSGVKLNASTGLVATIVLGIAVDDTIHLLAHFNRSARNLADESRGVIEALRRVGKPVTYTTAALCLGFLCLTASEMRPQVEFGYLAAVTLLAAWLVDVTFTPALAARMQIVTIWEVLTLDLGAVPNESIPLFSGLSETQARIAALLARIERFPEGHAVTKSGEVGRAMYVVIDGELKATVHRGDREVLLRKLTRGDVIGEVALFLGTRTADVTALSDVRLLRLDQHDFGNIQRRHPRIGATLYANLNKVLADRMASLTTRTDTNAVAAGRTR
ncbi:MAG: efflux RND transporter permease subunit [Myxococcota bacterium]|nr:efflux RND transporter permease subunit [Myxococcota bacterium]